MTSWIHGPWPSSTRPIRTGPLCTPEGVLPAEDQHLGSLWHGAGTNKRPSDCKRNPRPSSLKGRRDTNIERRVSFPLSRGSSSTEHQHLPLRILAPPPNSKGSSSTECKPLPHIAQPLPLIAKAPLPHNTGSSQHKHRLLPAHNTGFFVTEHRLLPYRGQAPLPQSTGRLPIFPPSPMARSVVGHCGWEVLRMTVCVLACLLLALPGGLAFLPNFWSRVLTLSWDSHTHQYMTEQALLNVTLSTLRAVASGRDESGLGRGFWRAVGEVVWANAAMDFLSTTRSDPVYHFDSERVGGAQGMLRLLWAQTLLSARAGDYQGARNSLGQLFHSLQDFYSHSNWVEMGQRSIYLHLLHPEQPAVPVASEDTRTCAECYSATCRDNILLRERPPVLTTGYFSANPPKPAGKCSHGGLLDSSRHQGAQGGINKDSTSPFFSPPPLSAQPQRRHWNRKLPEIVEYQAAAGTGVCDGHDGEYVEEITAARSRAFSIIQARARASQQPGKYLLIPFHDPAVGPVYETEDPEQFMLYLEGLTALGGGDEPEMCLSAVQLALTHSPPLSEIFVFTDASPKDAHLYSTVEALTLEKQSKVSFLLTEDSRHRRERRSPDRFSLYSSLSSVSGGLAIFTSNSDIHRVSAIIEDHVAASKVTLLHVGSSSLSEATHFPFRVDSAVHSVTLHLTGTLKHCMLTSPSGESQSLLVRSGSLAELEVFQGLYRVILLPPIRPGQWHLSIEAEGPVTLNVIGDSTVDFLYYFAVAANGTHPGLERVEGSPVADVPTFLVLAVTGLLPNEEASFSHVTLLGANGESLLKVPLNSSSSSSSSGKQLVGSMASVPRKPFYVQLSGRDTTGNRLERVATEMIQPTHVQIQVLSAPPLVPGHTSKVTFDVLNYGPARHFTLTTADDHGFLTETMHRR
ncbi:hypothetical protein GJAV_G00058410 [Gymnothorax javanicus]|nr:hypothetical protein GJAV_G00058410 [Gymnothorax javanicus]